MKGVEFITYLKKYFNVLHNLDDPYNCIMDIIDKLENFLQMNTPLLLVVVPCL